MGGAIDRIAPGETAFGHRGARALTWLIGCAAEGPVDEAADWVRDTWEATERFAARGAYVNALEAERPVRDAYGTRCGIGWSRSSAGTTPRAAFSGNGIG